MSKRKIAAIALSGVALLGAQAVFPSAAPAAAVAETGQGVPAAPEISLLSGRYIGPQTVTLTAAAGTEIRYTLDGTHPTRHSALYSAPLSIDVSANVSAVAFTDRTASVPAISGLLIKTAEEPLAQFAVMSDIHLSTGDEVQQRKWAGYFDTLQRIVPSPDALISNGDQINDNSFNSAADHRFPRAMLEQNLARTGMSDTQVMMTFGNHDDYVTRMAEQYPEEWFPGTTGYYESAIGEFPAFVVNTESWSATQAEWLYGRLSEITQDPATQHLPIFVFGHRPIPATVWDGAQASNGGLKSNLSDFPQVMYFSGHSHLNITDERSIHQEDFTSVNEGSMSYGENDGKFQIFGAGLARDATIPTAQSVVVDVYADRVEIDRINYAAQPGRTYDEAGNWTFQADPPFASTGSLAGPSWVVARGATPAEVRAKFTYTSANRNTSAPAWGEEQPTVRQTESGPVLRLPQAADDQFAAEYTLSVRDVATGEITDLVPVNGRIYSDYVVAPKPAVLDIPLAVRAGNKVGQPVDRTLTLGREYEATLVAFDSYQNRSEPRAFRFVAGAIDRTPLDAAVAEAESVIAQTSRVLGILTPAEEADYELAIADVPTAEAALAALTELLPEAPATQDAADALSFAVADATAAVQTMLVAVDRAPLGAAIHAAETALDAAPKSGARAGAAPGSVAAAEREFRAQLASAIDLQGTLNVAQPKLDAATAALTEAQAAWAKAVAEQPGGETPGGETPGGETPGGETPGGETPGGETPGGKQPGTEQPGKTPGEGTPTAGEGSAGVGKLAQTGDAGNVGMALVFAAGLAAAGTLLLGVRRAQRRQ